MKQITACIATLLLCFLSICLIVDTTENEEIRPYEFSFNIQDFQHRYEKKDSEGIVTGEYGFITADGVYHETGYATDKNGDFTITKMRNRKITSLEVAQEIFKGKPEVAKRVIQVLAKSCGGCGIPVINGEENNINKEKMRDEINKWPLASGTIGAALTKMANILSKEAMKKEKETGGTLILGGKLSLKEKVERDEILSKMVTAGRQVFENEISNNEARKSKFLSLEKSVIEEMAEDLFYRFNYTITSHGHEESGYRDGQKDGSYRSQGVNGTDAKVDYLSNEFGHQPNITFVHREEPRDAQVALKGFSFEWIYDKH